MTSSLSCTKRSITERAKDKEYTELIDVAKKDDIEKVRKPTTERAKIRTKKIQGRTPLMRAASSGCIDCLKDLLDAGADVNTKDRSGEIALIKAAKTGNSEMIQLLFEKGVDSDSQKARAALARFRNGYVGISPRPILLRTPSLNQEIRKISNYSYEIDHRLYNYIIKGNHNLSEALKRVTFIPKLDNNKKQIGFEVKDIVKGSLLYKIGLRQRDIVMSINGRELASMTKEDTPSFIDEMREAKIINIGIMWMNHYITISYKVK